MDPELIEFAHNLLELVGDDGVFEFEGQTYYLDPNYRQLLREMTNKQLEEAFSRE